MEKRDLSDVYPARAGRPPRRDTTYISLAAIIVGTLFLGALPNIASFWDFGLWGDGVPSSSSTPPPHPHNDSDPNNPWESIIPSSDLQWSHCYTHIPPGTFLCARLSVPMIYDDDLPPSSSAPIVDIALLLLPASTPSNAPKSPLLLNPGGPGGSGVQLTLLLGSSIQGIFGPDQPVLGFDPRGVGYTTPLADCWARPPPCENCPEDSVGGLMHRIEWNNVQQTYGFINDSDVSLRYLDAGQRGVNDLCREKAGEQRGGNGIILKYAGTKYTARDMLSIVDAWDRWTEKENGMKVGEYAGTRLTYWGFSYGTYLGMTFARMFPDRVGRMILDGVVDSDNYEKEVWAESLLDADKILDKFFEYCAEAEGKCAFWNEGDGADELRSRYEDVMEALDSEEGPITFTHPKFFFPVVLRRSYFRLIVFGTLKSPVLTYPALAEVLKILAEKRYKDLSIMFTDLQVMCLLPGGGLPFNVVSDAQRAIMCADKDEKQRVNLTIPQIRDAFGKMAKLSQFADIWVGLMLQCNGWDVSKPYKLESDTEKQWIEASNHETQINTSFPILFMGNTYDPVTPLKAAVKMSLRFKDAGVLELKAEGHCTISAVSICIAKAVRDYVVHGKVPPPAEVDGHKYLEGKWTKCEADAKPWKTRVGSVGLTYQTKEDVKLMEAFNKVHQVMGSVGQFEPGFHGTKEARVLRQDLVSRFGGDI
ncbi:hypothetical protein QBC43DRAFT_201868 [Cladorrhinum sp. PSN259]|nr:hypothetical protein QBC43DRAFT_201868 [Cladorrhinum sp. PSN259]